MHDILVSLQELDRLYGASALTEYEQTWQSVEQQVRLVLPGFTIAYAEVYMAGQEREAHGGMRHVLFPSEREPSSRIGCGNCPYEY
jgi:hypothetical protein